MVANFLGDFPDEAAFHWRSDSMQTPPRQWKWVEQVGSDAVLTAARQGVATVWCGDYHQAKQVLAAMKKRLNPKKVSAAIDLSAAERFHRHRMQQAQRSRLLNMLAVPVLPEFHLPLSRAPEVSAPLAAVFDDDSQPFLLPLNRLLGFIGAWEWQQKGVYIEPLGERIHIPYGVFSPIRGEYLDLIADVPLPDDVQTVFDIGTGSGVLALLLAKRGVPNIVATDTNPKAIACASENAAALGLSNIEWQLRDLFPEGRADVIVCNPPWLPAKPTSAIETALYDPKHAMLTAFLQQSRQHLNAHGEVWLIMSDLAEHLGLRTPDFLEKQFAAAGLAVRAVMQTRPKHMKAVDKDDPLVFARMKETTFLYRLQAL